MGALLLFPSLPGLPAAASGSPSVVISGVDPVAPSGSDTFSVTLSDFDASATFSVVLSVSSGAVSVAQSGSATNSTGYPAFVSGTATGTEVGFTSTYAEAQTMLANVSFTAAGSTGAANLSISIAERPSGSGLYYWPGDGTANSARYYKGVSSSGISWSAAETAAKSAANELGGIRGYLVRPSTYAENQFLAQKTTEQNIWIAASRGNSTSDSLPGSGEQDWYWPTHTGANGPSSAENGKKFFDEATDLFYIADGSQSTADWLSSGTFVTPWASGEPNGGWTGTTGRNAENKAVTNWNGVVGKWNDLIGSSTSARGYVIEYNAHEMTSLNSVTETSSYTVATAPATPTSLDGGAASTDGSISLTWTAPNNNGSAITSYSIQSRELGTSSWAAATDTDGNLTDNAATITGLSSCISYEFRIAAINAAGTGSYSTAVSVTSFGSTGLTALSSSQIVPVGDTELSSGTYVLTPDLGNKKGAIWSGYRLDLSKSFCIEADIQLSNAVDTTGADGVAFVLQPSDTTSLSSGGGLGYYSGVKPSVVVEFDTYPNGTSYGDSASGQDVTLVSLTAAGTADWTAFDQSNYNVTTDGYSLEDGEFHSVRIRYDANQELFTVLVDLNADADFADTGERVVDGRSADLAQFFTDEASTNYVYWGFTAATGGSTNEQAVKNLKSYPLQLAANTSPTATSPGPQTVDVGASKNIAVAIDDSSETTQAQWRLSVASANTSFVTASVSAASATQATVAVTGVADGDTTITLTATDADGASVAISFAIRVGDGSPAAPTTTTTRTTTPTVVVPPVVVPAVPPRVTTPPRTSVPVVQSGPVLTGGVVPAPPKAPTVVLGGKPTLMTTSVPSPTQLDVKAGRLSLGVKVLEDQGTISEAPDGTTQIAVKKGTSATITGTGFKPAATVQVFLPLDGDNAKELTRIPVGADGSFDGSAPFATKANEAPLPVGKQVLQLVSLDNDGNQVVVEMTVNIAQGAPAPEANRIEGVIPAMQPGQSIATSGGEPIPVTITPVSDQKLAVVEGEGWTMAVNVNSEQGGVEPAEGGALLKLVRNETALVSGSGFMPGTRADVWLFSDPTLLGTVTIDENGEFTGEVNIDPNMIPVGQHTLQLQGVGEDGYVKAANMGVLVDDPAEAVADTATASLTFLWWIIAAVLVVLVLVVLLVSRRRRTAG